MELVAAVIVLGPVVLLMALLFVRIRQQWPRRPVAPFDEGPRQGGDGAGDREPRRPLAPASAGSVALPLPPEEESGRSAPPRTRPAVEGPEGLRAS